MKLWILGAEGFLGRSLVRRCQEEGIPYLASGRSGADITDSEKLKRAADAAAATHIVNCAAYTDVDRAEREPELCFRINAAGPENIGKVAEERGIQVVHLSTDYVFNGEGETPFTETDQCEPLGVYGRSKWEGEMNLLNVLSSACIIRTSWIFGVGGKNFISSVLTKMQQGEEVSAATDQRGRPTYCKDLSQAILALLSSEGVFHFANAGEGSRYELCLDIFEEAKRKGLPLTCRAPLPILSQAFPTAAKRPAYSVLSTAKFEAALEMKPRPWKEVLKEYLKDAAA